MFGQKNKVGSHHGVQYGQSISCLKRQVVTFWYKRDSPTYQLIDDNGDLAKLSVAGTFLVT